MRADGHKVLVHYGTNDPPAGDIAIANIDLTVIPPAYISLFDHYPRVINGATTSISKRGFSQLILDRDSTWGGPVIIKTDANFGGRIDQQLRQRALQAGHAPDIPQRPGFTGLPDPKIDCSGRRNSLGERRLSRREVCARTRRTRLLHARMGFLRRVREKFQVPRQRSKNQVAPYPGPRDGRSSTADPSMAAAPPIRFWQVRLSRPR